MLRVALLALCCCSTISAKKKHGDGIDASALGGAAARETVGMMLHMLGGKLMRLNDDRKRKSYLPDSFHDPVNLNLVNTLERIADKVEEGKRLTVEDARPSADNANIRMMEDEPRYSPMLFNASGHLTVPVKDVRTVRNHTARRVTELHKSDARAAPMATAATLASIYVSLTAWLR